MILPGDLIERFRYALDNKWGYIWGAAGSLWTEAKQKAATREQTVKWGAQWIGHMVADCSGLFKWAFRQLGGDIYHGSNTMYLKYCTRKGKLKGGQRTDGEPLKPGTAVFVWNENDQKYSHVGLYIGDGAVIEAAGTRQGVIKSKVTDKKWSHWGELKGVDYDVTGTDPETGTEPTPGTEPEPAPEPEQPTIRKGSRGEAVRKAQNRLMVLGYDCGGTGADGIFGAKTEAAVKSFQIDRGLTADGVIGKMTWAALEGNTGGDLDEKPGADDSGGDQSGDGDTGGPSGGGDTDSQTGGEPKPEKLFTLVLWHLPEKEAMRLASSYEKAEIMEEGDSDAGSENKR